METDTFKGMNCHSSSLFLIETMLLYCYNYGFQPLSRDSPKRRMKITHDALRWWKLALDWTTVLNCHCLRDTGASERRNEQSVTDSCGYPRWTLVLAATVCSQASCCWATRPRGIGAEFILNPPSAQCLHFCFSPLRTRWSCYLKFAPSWDRQTVIVQCMSA